MSCSIQCGFMECTPPVILSNCCLCPSVRAQYCDGSGWTTTQKPLSKTNVSEGSSIALSTATELWEQLKDVETIVYTCPISDQCGEPVKMVVEIPVAINVCKVPNPCPGGAPLVGKVYYYQLHINPFNQSGGTTGGSIEVPTGTILPNGQPATGSTSLSFAQIFGSTSPKIKFVDCDTEVTKHRAFIACIPYSGAY